MEPLQELLAVDQRRALEFFVTGLQDVSDPGVDRQELLYNASVLAHYAQVSTCAELEMPAPANLSAVFDNFVLNTSLPPRRSPDGDRWRPVPLPDRVLRGSDARAARHPVVCGARRRILHPCRRPRRIGEEGAPADMIARHFEPWRQRHARLSRELRDQQYLLTPPHRS